MIKTGNGWLAVCWFYVYIFCWEVFGVDENDEHRFCSCLLLYLCNEFLLLLYICVCCFRIWD